MATEGSRRSPRAVSERLHQRSAELRDEWAKDPATEIDDRVRALLSDIVSAGVFIEDELARASLMAEVGSWRRWFASVRRQFVDPGVLAPFKPSDGTEYTPITVEMLLKELGSGNSVHRRLVRGGDFREVKRERLAEAFAAGKIVNSRFEKCNFESAEFGSREVFAGQGANLIYVEFVNCRWDRVRWPGVRASSLAFKDATNVFDADFEGASFSDVLFRNFGGERFRFVRASFTECHFSDVSFEGGDFTGATFTWCRFERVAFKGCDLSQTAFYGCDLRGTAVAGGSLEQVLFSDCGLEGVELSIGKRVARLGKAYPQLDEETRWDTSFDVPDTFEILRSADSAPDVAQRAETAVNDADRLST